jgi:hypothetical protein
MFTRATSSRACSASPAFYLDPRIQEKLYPKLGTSSTVLTIILSHFGTLVSSPRCRRVGLYIQIGDIQGIVLDKFPARLDNIAHQARENLIGHVGLVDLDTQHRAVVGVESGFP